MKYSHKEILDHTKQILIQLFELDESLLTPDARLYEDLDIDSIDTVDMLIELKRLTGVNVKPEHFKQARTLQDIVEVVAKL